MKLIFQHKALGKKGLRTTLLTSAGGPEPIPSCGLGEFNVGRGRMGGCPPPKVENFLLALHAEFFGIFFPQNSQNVLLNI